MHYVLFEIVGRDEALSVEGIPVGGHLGAVGILDDDAIDGEENLGGFPDGEVPSKGGAGDHLNLGGAVAFFYPFGVLSRFGDEPMLEFGFGDDRKAGILEVEAVGVAVLDDEAFFAAAVDPGVEDVVFDIEELGEAVSVPRAAARGEGVDDLKFLTGGVGGDAVGKAVGPLPCAGVDDHFSVDKPPEDDSFACFLGGAEVFNVHEEIGDEPERRFEEDVFVVF